MKNDMKKNFCVILAGGRGMRLWPCSRGERPKQFIDFFGTGRSGLQQTFDRYVKILPQENIYVSTNTEYLSLVREQLPELAEENILDEPVSRNTAPSLAWAAHRACEICPEANILAAPADQIVLNEEAFGRSVCDAFDFVSEERKMLVLGVKPTRPEPGYGYIQTDGVHPRENVWDVRSFIEKPERELAQMLMDSGEFFWNTGIFVGHARQLLDNFMRLLPVVMRHLKMENTPEQLNYEREFVKTNYPAYPNLSIDEAILERTEDVYVQVCDFGWADLGTWHGIFEQMPKNNEQNVVLDSEVVLDDCRNNIIKVPSGKLAVINGLDSFIVAEEGNVLLICKKSDSSALIRKYVNELQIRLGEEYV